MGVSSKTSVLGKFQEALHLFPHHNHVIIITIKIKPILEAVYS